MNARLFVAVMLAVAGLGLALLSTTPPAGAQDCSGTVHKGVCFPTGDTSFADATVVLERGEIESPPNGDESSPLGPPDDFSSAGGGPASPGSVSLGDGGTLVVQFTDNVLSGSGTPDADLWIFEAGTITESAVVAVSADGGSWTDVGTTSRQTEGFDLDAFGFDQSAQLSYVRVIDDAANPEEFGDHQGADIDAVGAVTVPSPPDPDPDPGACNGLVATITGTIQIEGGSNHDVIVGSVDVDVIFGSSGHDTICGGGGFDTINGDSGNDVIIGTGTLIGDSGNDIITATDPNSTIDGGSGTDVCIGTTQVVDCEL